MQTLLDRLLQLQPTAKRTTLRQMLGNGRILIDGRPARSLKQPLDAAARVTIANHAPRAVRPPLPLQVIHEDEDVLVLVKPPGLLTSTGPRESRQTVLKLVQEHF